VTSLPVLFAAVGSEGRLRVSPMLGYASVLLVLVVTCVGIWLLVRVASHWDSGDDDGGDSGGGGNSGGGGGDPPSPPNPQPDAEPEWWPEFERAFAAHVNARLTRSE
jgi:hypothetical protein